MSVFFFFLSFFLFASFKFRFRTLGEPSCAASLAGATGGRGRVFGRGGRGAGGGGEEEVGADRRRRGRRRRGEGRPARPSRTGEGAGRGRGRPSTAQPLACLPRGAASRAPWAPPPRLQPRAAPAPCERRRVPPWASSPRDWPGAGGLRPSRASCGALSGVPGRPRAWEPQGRYCLRRA